jgi:MATE family multidrug resistance protein
MFKEFGQTFRIAIPLILSNISQVALGLIDSAMIGVVDYRQLAAASLVVNLVAIPQVLCVGMTMSMSPLIAIAHGRNDVHRASALLFNGVLLCTLVTLLLVLSMVASQNMLLHLGQDAEVALLAQPYYRVMAWSLVPMLVFLSVKQFTDSLAFTRTAMLLSLLSIPFNAFLNWLFIYGHWGFPRLELLGTGIATLITRCCMAIALVVIVCQHRLFRPYVRVKQQTWRLHWPSWKELLHIGIPSSLQYGMEAGAFSVSGVMIGWLGATVQAAHQIALNCASLTFMASLGISLAGSIRISYAYGRHDTVQLRQVGTSTIKGGLLYGAVCGVLFIVFRSAIPQLFTRNAAVESIAAGLLLYGALFQVSDATQAIGVGLLRGMKDVRLPTLFVAIAYWVIGIPLGYLLAFRLQLGAAGIWIGFITGLTASSVLLNTRFLHRTTIPPSP